MQARFDYNLKYRDQCDPNTRLEALSTIYHWLNPSDARLENIHPPLFSVEQDAPVFWVHGVAGTGKSTLAQSAAEWCEEARFLGASFFCAREGERSNVQLIFTSIAYQLSFLSGAFREEVEKAMKANPDIHTSVAARQLLKLVVEPLRAIGKGFPPCAIIVDALDECNDANPVSIILKALAAYLPDLWPLKFIITSRPVPSIDAGFRNKTLLVNTQQFPLSAIPPAITQRDITIFLRNRLAAVKQDFIIHGDWPAEKDVDALAELASGLFIFAATATKFIADGNIDDPQAQLDALLHSGEERSVPRTSTSPFTHLDKLYLQVLETAYPNSDSNLAAKARVKTIIGSIIFLRDELSPGSLDDLFCFKAGSVRTTLHRVHSIITVPSTDDDAIRIIHKSFSDFLVDPLRCSSSHFLVKPRLQQTLIAKACLQTLQTLKRNVCDVQPDDESLVNNDIPNLSQSVLKCIPPHLRYSCRHWASHLRASEVDQEIWDLLELFCRQKLLHWLEALSLLGDLDFAIEALQFAREALEVIFFESAHSSFKLIYSKVLPLPSSDIPMLLYDCERVVRSFYPALSISCFQAYRCAVPFSPINTLFRTTYSHQAQHTITIRNGAQQAWSLNTTVAEAHSSWVQSVAYSPDGARIASGSNDHTIRLWNARTAAQLNVFQGHTGKVFSVAFSLDGKEIMSGSEDRTVKIWDASTGACLESWEWHTSDVRSVTYSPAGQYAASCSSDHTVVLWQLASPGVGSAVFSDHWAMVYQIVFSHDGTLLLSAGGDQDSHVWDVSKRARVQTLRHDYIMMSIAVSHDDQLIACGLADSSVVLWRRDGWTRLHVLNRHGTVVWGVAFSPDDRTLASGSWDRTICLWDAKTGAHLETLHEHSDQVLSLDFSPDGLWLVTGSCDTTVRIWEVPQSALRTTRTVYARSRPQEKSPASTSSAPLYFDVKRGTYLCYGSGPEHHASPVRSVAFSPDGLLLVTGAWDGKIRVWDTASGKRMKTLWLDPNPEGQVATLTWSHRGNRVAAGGGDTKIRIWDVDKALCIQTYTGHSGTVWKAVFSFDEQHIISASDDRTIRSWALDGSRALHGKDDIIFEAPGPVMTIAQSDDSNVILSSALDLIPDTTSGYPTVRLHDRASGNVLWKHNFSAMLESFAFSRDCTRALVGSGNGQISLLDLTKIYALAISSTARMPQTSYAEVKIRTWDSGDGYAVEHVSFSADESAVISDASFTSLDRASRPLNAPDFEHSAPSVFLLNGWLWRATPERRRICWIPPTYRHTQTTAKIYMGTMETRGNLIAFGTNSGLVVIIDASNC
jgi:WD40 repeat protein